VVNIDAGVGMHLVLFFQYPAVRGRLVHGLLRQAAVDRVSPIMALEDASRIAEDDSVSAVLIDLGNDRGKGRQCSRGCSKAAA
jgi:hypothetical protein